VVASYHARLPQGGDGEDRKAPRRVLLPPQLAAPEDAELIVADGNNLRVSVFGRRPSDSRHDRSLAVSAVGVRPPLISES